MTTPLHCKVCAKPLRGQQRLYCGRPCKRRAYAAKQKLREARELADVVEAGKPRTVPKPQPPQIEVIREGFDPVERDISVITTLPQPSLSRRLYAYIQLLGGNAARCRRCS